MGADHDPLAALRDFFRSDSPNHIAAAVSGGSDSLALLALLKDWRDDGGPDVSAITVDHGLRPEAAQEAAGVARICARWGMPHQVLHWSRVAQSGNLHDQARRARYDLMAQWAASQGIGTIALGHTLDDQAETFVMRLARGSGVDGLAAMRRSWDQDGITFARPLLRCRREGLRCILRDRGLAWVDDAANSDPTYDRSRTREALIVLEGLGLSALRLSDVSAHLAQAREALDTTMLEAARQIAQIEWGDVVIDHSGLMSLHPDLSRRLLLAAMRWINGEDYPPRGEALSALMARISKGESATLQGCDLRISKGNLRITREVGALRGVVCDLDTLWDGRWRMTGPDVPGARILALGEEGLKFCPDRRDSPLPARSLMATPAVWRGKTVLSAPLAGLENGWSATLLPRQKHDFAARIKH